MNITFHIARTDEEREAVYRFRRRVLDETAQTPVSETDRTQGFIRDEYDAAAQLVYALADGEVAGAVSLLFGADFPFTRAQQLKYNLRRFYQVVGDEEMLILRHFLIASTYQDSPLALQLLREATRLIIDKNVALVFCDCQLHLVRFYQEMGFRSYQCEVFNDPEFGLKIPLTLVVGDVEFLQNIASPLHKLLSERIADPQVARQLVALLGNAAVKKLTAANVQGDEHLLDVSRLGQAPIFENLGVDELQVIINAGHVIQFAPGDQIIGKDDLSQTMFILLSGSMEIRDGDMVVRQVEQGEVIGELAFLLSTQRTVDIFAGSKGARVLSLDEADFRERLQTAVHPEALLLLNLSKILALKLATVTRNLRKTHQRLIYREKLASLGQLTAGIAHELKNPLNFVNNFAGLNKELTQELLDALAAKDDIDRDQFGEILNMIKSNSEQTEFHGKRANAVVENMMSHAGHERGERRWVSINSLVENITRMVYRSYQSSHPDMEISIRNELDVSAGEVLLSPKEIGRVLQNLLDNAFEAIREKKQFAGEGYEPEVSIRTRLEGEQIEIRITDNGPGIRDQVRDKVFEPFYTTKPAGTGLGLSMSHDIVTQGHGGDIRVESVEDGGATFIITLPVNGQ